MKRNLVRLIFVFSLFLSCKSFFLSSGEHYPFKDCLTVLSWNVQNLFDDQDDGGEYPNYRQIKLLWNTKTFYNKLENIQKFLDSLEELPDILIFQEVEKPEILRILFERFLKTQVYKVVIGTHKAHPQVVVATRLDLDRIETFALDLEDAHVRQAIKISFTWQNIPMSVVGVHWKSWAGKNEVHNAFIRKREITALGEWLAKDKQAEQAMIIMGDLNMRRNFKDDSNEINSFVEAGALSHSSLKIKDLVANRKDGTYAQKGSLVWLDGILLVGDLPNEGTYEIKVHDHSPHLCTPKNFPYAYNEYGNKGVSDHFPFSFSFKIRRTEN